MGKQFSKENPLSIFQISICLPLPPFITDTILLLLFFLSFLLQKVTELNQLSLTPTAFHSQKVTIPCKMFQSPALQLSGFVSPEEAISAATSHKDLQGWEMEGEG